MRRDRAWRPVGLAVLLMAGCVLPGEPRPDAPAGPFLPAVRPGGADAILMEVAMIETPLGDRYADAGFWDEIDEQVVPLDRKAALVDNGFRVGLVGGMRPARFDQLLQNERSNPNPHRVQMRAGYPKVLVVGPPRSVCQFQLAGAPTPVAFEAAQCAVQVTPTPAQSGCVKLAFVPLVQHGAKSPWPGLAAEDPAQSGERYAALGWEVTVSAGQFAVVGTRFEQPGTLGHACFVSTDGPRPAQRLLAIRAARVSPAGPEGSDQ